MGSGIAFALGSGEWEQPAMTDRPKRPLLIRVTPSIFDRLETASELTGVSVTSLIELCVSQRLDAVVANHAERSAAGVQRILAGASEAREETPRVSAKGVAKGK